MAILHQEYGVTIEVCIRQRAVDNKSPALAYGLRLLCEGRPLWNVAVVDYGAEPSDYGWLWDAAPPRRSLFETIEIALASRRRRIRWQTQRGGILLAEAVLFGTSTRLFVGIGSVLLAPDARVGGSSVGWALTPNRAELASFAAALRREWEQLEV